MNDSACTVTSVCMLESVYKKPSCNKLIFQLIIKIFFSPGGLWWCDHYKTQHLIKILSFFWFPYNCPTTIHKYFCTNSTTKDCNSTHTSIHRSIKSQITPTCSTYASNYSPSIHPTQGIISSLLYNSSAS